MVQNSQPPFDGTLWPWLAGGGAGRSHTHAIDQQELLVQSDPNDQKQGAVQPDPLSTLAAATQPGLESAAAVMGEFRLATASRYAVSHHPNAGFTSSDAAIAAALAPLTFSRGNQAWDQARVEALISSEGLQAGWLPDMRGIAPTQLQIQNSQQRELLRFTNSIANTGAGHLQVRRGEPLDPLSTDPAEQALLATAISLGLDPSEVAVTAQDLLDANGNVVAVVGDAALSEFHPEHRHFHIGETAQFSLERFDAAKHRWDPITGIEVVKTTFCLIDINRIQPVAGADPYLYEVVKSPAKDNLYNDCYADIQGIQSGWIDRYSHSLPGQEIDITNLPAGTYRVKSVVNPSQWFLESDYSNNVGWTGFELSRNSRGNARLQEIEGLHGGIWFSQTPNGMG